MDLYAQILSPYAARVVLAARYKGVKYKMSLPEGGSKTPVFLKLNPLGKYPVIKDGKTVLFESGVIVEYLDAKYKKKRLIPAAAKAAAEARLLAALFSEYVQPPTLALFGQIDPAKRDQAVMDAKISEINKALDIIEGRIAAKPFAIGKFSIADCYGAPVLFFLGALLPKLGVSNALGERKKLNRYFAKLRKDKVAGGVIKEMAEALQKHFG